MLKSYQKTAFLATPEGGDSSATKQVSGHRAALPSPAERRVCAAPYPITANANTLTVHTITPAIVIRTVCCHMVSIPYSG